MASKTTVPAPRSELLTKAVDGKRAEIAAHRQRHSDLINSLAENPSDDGLLRDIAAVEEQLSRANAAIGALEMAAAEAAEQETRERETAAREATQQLRDKTIDALRDRAVLAARVDAAGAQLVEAIKAWRACGRTIAADASAVMNARIPGEMQRMSAAGQVMPHAHGTHMTFAYGLGRLMREVLAAFDGESAREVVLVNAYLNVDGATFVAANETSVAQAAARL